MVEKKKLLSNIIREYWDRQAIKYDVSSERIANQDRHQSTLEIQTVLAHLKRDDRVLEVGCGNGFSTSHFAPFVREIMGVDFSVPMIERARKDFGYLENTTFLVQDVRYLSVNGVGFDVVVSERCLINVPSWEEQKQAIDSIWNVLRKDGRFLMVEGIKQGRDNLNHMRKELGLSRMPDVGYNVDFEEGELLDFLKERFKVKKIRKFGMYDFISRIVHPMLVAPDEPRYEAKINEIAKEISYKIEGFDEVSRLIFLELIRKD